MRDFGVVLLQESTKGSEGRLQTWNVKHNLVLTWTNKAEGDKGKTRKQKKYDFSRVLWAINSSFFVQQPFLSRNSPVNIRNPQL